MTYYLNKFLKLGSGLALLFGALAAVHDVQRGIFLLLAAILFHLWSEEK